MTELLRCPYCGGFSMPKYIGDNKEYVVYVCANCGRTPVHTGAASPKTTGDAHVSYQAVKKHLRREDMFRST